MFAVRTESTSMSSDKRAEVTNELLLEALKAIQGTLTRLVDDMHEVKERLGILEMQYASLSGRMDRMDLRIERIERRLGLIEA
jgi:predicted  nucleic acid-binding Zn-ribbon protein